MKSKPYKREGGHVVQMRTINVIRNRLRKAASSLSRSFTSVLLCIVPCAVIMLAGCREPSNNTSASNSSNAEEEQREDTWFDLKPISQMARYVGVWEGEAFAVAGIGDNGQLKSGKEMREEFHRRHGLSDEERKKTETFYKLRLTIEKKELELGEKSPYSATVTIETHWPNRSVEEYEEECLIRIADDATIELRELTSVRTKFSAELADDPDASETMLTVQNLHDVLPMGVVTLHRVSLPAN